MAYIRMLTKLGVRRPQINRMTRMMKETGMPIDDAMRRAVMRLLDDLAPIWPASARK